MQLYKLTDENFLEDFEIYFDSDFFINNMNAYLYIIIQTRKWKEKKIILASFYDSVVKVTRYDERGLSTYLNNNLDGILNNAIIEAKYPGLVSKIVEGIPYLVPFLDKIMEYKRLSILINIIIRLMKIELTFLDVFKDLALAITCMIVVGGPIVVWEFFTNFSSFIVFIFFATVILPQGEIWLKVGSNINFLKACIQCILKCH